MIVCVEGRRTRKATGGLPLTDAAFGELRLDVPDGLPSITVTVLRDEFGTLCIVTRGSAVPFTCCHRLLVAWVRVAVAASGLGGGTTGRQPGAPAPG
jgi:hypothetical protein